jgi:replicative DNA helicase
MFDEKVFLWSLTARPEDARIFLSLFKPEWLEDPVHQVFLRAMFTFLKQHKIPPDLKTLESLLQQEDVNIYNLRLKPALEELRKLSPAVPEQVYVLDQAREVAVVRSFEQMVQQNTFQSNLKNYDGKIILRNVTQWFHQFEENKDEITLRMDEATERIIRDNNVHSASFQMPTNIGPIDDWTHGGLRSRQLGIFIAPTGHGKSAALMNIAYNMAIQDEMDVWFITNELTIEEQAERFMSRITGVEVNKIQSDPYTAYSGMGQHWKATINKRLLMTSVNREISTDQIETMMMRHANLYGWKPRVLCLDFMERMKPNEAGYKRDSEWNWIGGIAKDLVRLAKRHNMIVWTAAQTNRSGMADGMAMTLSMAQGSIRHLQEATVVIGMRKVYVEGDEDSGTETIGMEFTPLKMRHGKTSYPKILELDLAKMRITNKIVERPVEVEHDGEEDDAKSVSYKKDKRRKK